MDAETDLIRLVDKDAESDLLAESCSASNCLSSTDSDNDSLTLTFLETLILVDSDFDIDVDSLMLTDLDALMLADNDFDIDGLSDTDIDLEIDSEIDVDWDIDND